MIELSYFENIANVYCVTALILSIGLVIASLEDLKVFNVFSSGGLLSWKTSRLFSRWSCRGLTSKVADFLFKDNVFKSLLYLKCFFSLVLLVLSLMGIVYFWLFFILFILHSLIFLRTPYSLDGGYQMSIVVLLSLVIGSFFGVYSREAEISLFFVAGQLLLSYFISGLTKLLSPVWRKSYAMNVIFSTKVYGHPYIYRLVSRSKLFAYISSWAVILFEALFFFVCFLVLLSECYFYSWVLFFILAMRSLWD